MSAFLYLIKAFQEKGILSLFLLLLFVMSWAFLIAIYKMVYLKNERFRDMLQKNNDDKIGRLVEAIEKLTHKIDDISLVIAKNFVTKIDLEKDEWRVVIMQLDEAVDTQYKYIEEEFIRNIDKPYEALENITKFVHDIKLRGSVNFTKQGISPAVYAMVIETDKDVLPIAIQQMDSLIETCKNTILTVDKRIELISRNTNEFRLILKSKWKDKFIEKMNFKDHG